MDKIMGSVSFDNEHMKRGRDLEPKVRAEMEKRLGYELHPLCAISDSEDYIRASFDGINIEKGTLIEIKCPGEKDHLEAKNGRVPEKYKCQLQWQMIVAGFKSMTYVSFFEGDLALVDVNEDVGLQLLLKQNAAEFWHNVKAKNLQSPPITVDEDLSVLVEKTFLLKEKIKAMEAELDFAEDTLKKSLGEKDKIQLTTAVFGWNPRKGNVDYAAIPELKNVDLEKYRKPESKTFYIKRVK
jgi:putative phage-type endonuclease